MNTTTSELIKKFNTLTQEIEFRIALLTNGERIEFGENSFKDEANNYITAVDDNSVYFEGDESYPTHELGFWDAITVIETIQLLKQTIAFKIGRKNQITYIL